MIDGFNRKIDYIRISVTDKCNLRCIYCAPSSAKKDLTQYKVLSIDEIFLICSAMSDLGVTKVKITGGEPLVRDGICELISKIKSHTHINNITITTNGLLLNKYTDGLISCGIDGINISLDSTDRERYKYLTGFDNLEKVMHGIDNAYNMGIKNIKINCVPISDVNEDDLINIALMAKDRNINVRFIELMPMGYGKQFTSMSTDNVKSKIEKELGILTPFEKKLGNGPAQYYSLDGFKGKIGFISALSDIFCSSCNRIRLTSAGYLKTCLHYNKGLDLSPFLNKTHYGNLKHAIEEAVKNKPISHSFDNDDIENIDNNNMISIGG